jgi:uncharacterized membrane protein YgdD (TMEM256/DUF423 family)
MGSVHAFSLLRGDTKRGPTMSGWGWVRVGAVAGALAVIVGAFGAHWLKGKLSEQALVTFEIGVRYHMYHSLALVALGAFMIAAGGGQKASAVAGWAFVVGILVFSGSLYLLALTGTRWLGAITPLGGVAFIVGWLALAVAAVPAASAPRTAAAAPAGASSKTAPMFADAPSSGEQSP